MHRCSLASRFCAAFCLLTLTLPNRFDTTIGFGNAGVEIIRQNLLKDSTTIGKLALDQSGSIMNCIFLFCDIRQFTDATEALQEEVFVFTNKIALVVHSICNTFGGSANKNIGDAFLVTWRLGDDNCANKSEDSQPSVSPSDCSSSPPAGNAMDAYRSVVSKPSSITTVLLRQDKLHSGFYPELPRHSRPGCSFIVHDPNKRKAYFYSRIEGSSGCPFLYTGSKASEWCGGGFVGNGTCSVPTFCCSRYGWCGKSAEFCSNKVDRQIESKSTTPCGGGKIGNGICSDPTSCCSRFGWCGKTPEHCGKAKFS